MNNMKVVLNCIDAFNNCNMEWLDTYYIKRYGMERNA
jgi:hypothetical protein